MWTQAVRDRLTKFGYRSTRTRDAIVSYLSDQRYLLPVDQISEAVSVDPVTVYRVLDVLDEIGVVIKIQSHPSYVTVPQSLRDTRFHAIFIDETIHQVLIQPYTPEWDYIAPTKTVVEIRGRLSTSSSDRLSHQKGVTPSDDTGEHTSPDGDDDAGVSHVTQSTTNQGTIGGEEQISITPDTSKTEQDISIDSRHIDRLQRF